jgi:hypothetical protein
MKGGGVTASLIVFCWKQPKIPQRKRSVARTGTFRKQVRRISLLERHGSVHEIMQEHCYIVAAGPRIGEDCIDRQTKVAERRER